MDCEPQTLCEPLSVRPSVGCVFAVKGLFGKNENVCGAMDVN